MRVKFLSSYQQDFLNKVVKESKLSTNELAALVGIHPRSFLDWKKEKLTMTLESAQKLSKIFAIELPEEEDVLVERWKNAQREANKVGGLRFKAKYGSPGTKEGRKKGGSNALKTLRMQGKVPACKHFDLPQGYSSELAEFVGILLGDGGITPTYCSITLNSEADADYIFYVQLLAGRLFSEKPKIYYRKNEKTCVIYYNGVELIKYLQSIGLKIGDKIKQQVTVPEWVLKDKDFTKKCLRGLMDTDGGVFVHRYKINGKTYSYKKLCFSNKSFPLITFVYESLRSFEFSPKIYTEVKLAKKRVWLYNEREVDTYFHIVGSSNSRLLKHYEESCQRGNGAAC